MGFSLSDLNPMSLISNAAQAVCHEVLPQKLQFMGDLVGLGLDYESGNWMKGIEDLQKLLTDLPQNSASPESALGSPQRRGDPLSSHSSEAPPPPQYASSSNIASSVARGTPPTATATTTTAALIPASANQSASTSSAPPPGTVAQATSAQPAASQSTAAHATSSPSTSTVPDDPFFHQSDADLMNKVVNGQIPDSVTKDPAKMQQLQARTNQISEMNQLISQMMAAIHEMHKQVIQNIRA